MGQMDTPTAAVVDPLGAGEECSEHRNRVTPTALRIVASRATLGSSCDGCPFCATCLGRAFRAATDGAEPLVGYRRALDAGRTLYYAGATCSSIYVVESGFFKTITLAEDGVAQVTGLQMSGDLLGMDGFGTGIHCSDAVAMSRASVCVIPRTRLLKSSAENEAVARHLFSVLSGEIASDHRALLLLGSRRAEERVAAFIVDVSERLAARGYSSSDIGLWMTREDIGSFLGLELETISRVLGRLKKRGLMDVHRRHLHIPSIDALREVIAGEAAANELRAPTRRGRRVAKVKALTAIGRVRTDSARRPIRRNP